jgi:hypothetical protein
MLMASLLRCSFFRFQPELDQAADGLGATDLVVVGQTSISAGKRTALTGSD